MERRHTRAAAPLALLLSVAPGTALAQADDWCRDRDRDRPSHCEVREMTMSPSGSLRVNAEPNGGISVEAWERNEVLVRARITSRAGSEERAREIVGSVTIDAGAGTVRADGPESRDREGWSVSYRIYVPARYDLDLGSTNGGIAVAGVRGAMRLGTTNGGLHLTDIGGDVRGRTTNGGLHVELSGDGWEGEGLDAQTTNGGVHLDVPDGYSARLELETTNGGFSIDFPVTVQGRLGRRIDTSLGSGGATIRLVTTNGGVEVRRS